MIQIGQCVRIKNDTRFNGLRGIVISTMVSGTKPIEVQLPLTLLPKDVPFRCFEESELEHDSD